jgi:hypothetical protein
VFVLGVLMVGLGLAMMVAGAVAPVDAARPGLIGGGAGVLLAGAVLAYLDAPGHRPKPAPGMERAKATILDATGTTGSVAGYQMVELTLEIQPQDGLPVQVKRKFSAGRLGRVEPGRKIDVFYDPADLQRIELA